MPLPSDESETSFAPDDGDIEGLHHHGRSFWLSRLNNTPSKNLESFRKACKIFKFLTKDDREEYPSKNRNASTADQRKEWIRLKIIRRFPATGDDGGRPHV